MPRNKARGQAAKTHEQFVRTLERKDNVPKARQVEAAADKMPTASKAIRRRDARASEFAVSYRGMSQESAHNKHNDPGQIGHRPQKRSRTEERP